MRLQKFIAACGVASRRKSEEIIKQGQIMVNDQVISEMGHTINPDKDIVKYKGKRIEIESKSIYILLNKPTGYITTVSEQFDRKKVTDLVDLKERLFPVGRLDYNTSGLLILTNDGDLTYKLTHPKHKVEKTYIAKINGFPNKETMNKFENGLEIEDYITSPAKFKLLKKESGSSIVQITITEGRNRQIRKMCDAIGHPVIDLERIAIGKITLNNLPLGKWRYLNKDEVEYLKKL